MALSAGRLTAGLNDRNTLPCLSRAALGPNVYPRNVNDVTGYVPDRRRSCRTRSWSCQDAAAARPAPSVSPTPPILGEPAVTRAMCEHSDSFPPYGSAALSHCVPFQNYRLEGVRVSLQGVSAGRKSARAGSGETRPATGRSGHRFDEHGARLAATGACRRHRRPTRGGVQLVRKRGIREPSHRSLPGHARTGAGSAKPVPDRRRTATSPISRPHSNASTWRS